MQITKAYRKEFISELAAMCGDEEYRDFKREIYGQAIFRSARWIAKEYTIKEYELEFVVEEFEVDNWLDLPSTNFKGETEVRINDIIYYKVNDRPTKPKEYVIKFGANGRFIMNYMDKAANDKVYVKYVTLGRTGDEFDGNPLIPDKHYEELINKAIVYIAKMGVAKFTAERREKYSLLLRMYDKGDAYDPNIGRDDQWIHIKPFNVFETWPPTQRFKQYPWRYVGSYVPETEQNAQYTHEPPDRGI